MPLKADMGDTILYPGLNRVDMYMNNCFRKDVMSVPVNVAAFTDDELKSRLVGYGVEVGPIVMSTRRVYELKLSEMIGTGGLGYQERYLPDENEYSDDDDTDLSQPILPAARPETSYGRRRIPEHKVTGGGEPSSQTEYKRPPINSNAIKMPGVGKPQTSAGISVWIKIIFLLTVLGFVYLVITNMDGAVQNKIP